jgi:DNA transposition AAA+ family ATPase
MAFTQEHKQRLEATLPPVEVTRQKVREYISRADMTQPQFAKMAGYSSTAVVQFMNGSYSQRAGTDVVIREALETAMQRNPVGVVSTEAAGNLYETENVADLRKWFNHCHRRRALAFCYGPPGSQKTYVLKHLIAEFNRRELAKEGVRNRAFYVRASVQIRPRDLLAKMCNAAGATSASTVQRCISELRRDLRDTQTLFVIDEAQALDIACLEAVRELHDEPPNIGSLLAGSHGLKQMFDRHAAQLEQWNSRLDAGIELRGVSEARARLIIHAELPQLSDAQTARLVDGVHVPDAYSKQHSTYLNVRRLFKNIEAFRLALEEKKAGITQ